MRIIMHVICQDAYEIEKMRLIFHTAQLILA